MRQMISCDEAIIAAKQFGEANKSNIFFHLFYDDKKVWLSNTNESIDKEIPCVAFRLKYPNKKFNHILYSATDTNFMFMLYYALRHMLMTCEYQHEQETVSDANESRRLIIIFDHYPTTNKTCIEQYIVMLCSRWDFVKI